MASLSRNLRQPGATLHLSAVRLPKLHSLGEAIEAGPWTFFYYGSDPALEERREVLFTLGNSHFDTRARQPRRSPMAHNPGAYLASC